MHSSVTSFLVSMYIVCMCGELSFSPVCFFLFFGLVLMRLIVVVGCVQSLSVAPVDCIPLLSTCGTNLTKHSVTGVQMEKHGTNLLYSITE